MEAIPEIYKIIFYIAVIATLLGFSVISLVNWLFDQGNKYLKKRKNGS